MKPPGMATGGEVKHFVDGGATDQQVADWWAANSDKGYSDAYIADLMDTYQVTPEQFARSIGANTETAADIASRYAAVPETRTITDSSGYDTQNIDLTRQSDGTYSGNNGQTYNADGSLYVAPPVTFTDSGSNTAGTAGLSEKDQGIWNFFSNNTNLTDAQIVAAMNANKWTTGDIARVTGTTANIDDYNRRVAAVNAANNTTTTTVSTGTGTGTTTRSAADQAIFNFFLTPGLTDAQIVAAMDANKWTIGDIARVTGTTSQLDDFNRRIAAVRNANNRTNTNTSTSTSTSTNTSIIRTTNTSTSTSTSTSTGTGSLTSVTAPWFINPQTFAQGTAGVTVPSSTLRPAGLPTDATSRAIQGDLLAAGPTASDATMQQFMDKQGYDPRQVAYAINAGVPEIQNRYYAAKNAGILGAAAPATTTLNQPYNTTAGITQLLSPTGPLGEFSTRTATPVTPVLPVTPTATALPNVSFNRTDIQQRMPNLQMGNAGTPLSVLAGQPTTYGVTGYTDAYSPFATPAPGAKLMNMGGIAGLAQGGYPRRTGQIDGPGTATSDSIPAMLSDGEFVMTAKAVRGAGKGDRRAGAKRMYALMHQLEKNAARG
jgi:bacterioferritin-associated ferredoxin